MDDITPAPPAAVVAASGSVSAVSWGAIFAGTAVAAATSLLLFALFAGLDLAALSRHAGAARGTPPSFTVMAAVALIVTQWVSACLGGYITGRLRTRWVGTHSHEVFFRDTAHGFITWCVATVLMASGLASTAASLTGLRVPLTGMRDMSAQGQPHRALHQAAGSVNGGVTAGAYRALDPQFAVAEGRIATEAPGQRLLLADGPARVEPGARTRLVAVDETADTDGSGVDVTPKDAAVSSILTALSMLIGAFIAGVSAALGGRLRDLHP
jgi:hypothetical protein